MQEKPKILLHACCAPCISHVYESLKDRYRVHACFYNPNIAPAKEYHLRLHELRKFSELKGFPLIEGEYDFRNWVKNVRDYRFYGERSPRCWQCYRLRLEETFRIALSLNIDLVGTVLSISPHKNAEMINRIGAELSAQYGIGFLEADFKKNDGFKKSVELSRQHGFYRQGYCGCIYSKLERNRESGWSRKVTAFREELNEKEVATVPR